MRGLLGLTLLVLAVCLAAGALPSAGFWWDFLAGLGYCAFALVAFMGWESESPARNPRLRMHRNLALLATLIAALHAVGYLIIDPIVVEHFLPTAPAFMLLGLLAFALLVATTYSSLPKPRQRTYRGFAAFRAWHRALYLLLLAATGWHVFGTQFSISSVWQLVPMVVLLTGAPLAAYLARRQGSFRLLTRAPASEEAADLHPLLCGLSMLALSAAFAGLKAVSCATC